MRMQRNQWILLVLISVASLFLRYLVQPNPQFDAFHDDFMMVNNANNIQQTGWLGDWTQYTLSKGPGYPIFLAIVGHLDWPVTVTIHFVVLFAAILLIRELFFLGAPIWYSLSSYAFIAFFPALFGNQMSRFYRESLLFTLALLFLTMILMFLRQLNVLISTPHFDKKILIKMFFVVVTIGFCIGFFYISKTSWQFLLIPLITGLGLALYCFKIHKRLRSKSLVVFLSFLILGSIVAAIPSTYVVYQNSKNYGTPLVDDFSQGGFPKALGALMRIEDNNRPEYVDVTAEMRKKAYAVSKTFAKLKPYLELPDNTGWRGQACTHLKICNESANWFNWDLRDAVAKANLANSSKEFQSTFNQIATDINSACSQGVITCQAPGITSGLRSLSQISPRLFVDAAGIGLQHVWSISPGSFSRGVPVLSSSQEVMDTWQSAIKQLGNITPPTSSWNIGSRNVEGVLGILSKVYSFFWPIFLLSGLIGLFLNRKKNIEDQTLRYLALSFWIAAGTLIAQVSLFEANSGLYMVLGGELYLLPVFPFLIAATIMGNFRIVSLLNKNAVPTLAT